MKAWMLAPLALLTGCAGLVYQEPASGPRARVRFVSDSTSTTVLRAYDDKNCTQNEAEWMRLSDAAVVRTSHKRLGIGLWNHNPNAAKEVYVSAARPMHGMFYGAQQVLTTLYSCAVPFSFSFAENTDYEVKYWWNAQQCRVTVSQITPNGNDWSARRVATFDNRTTEANAACMEQFRKVRLY